MDFIYLDKERMGEAEGRNYNFYVNFDRKYNYIDGEQILSGFEINLKDNKLVLQNGVRVNDYVVLNEEGRGSNAILHHLKVDKINTSPKIMTMYLSIV